MVKFLVEHGACIFATTLSDHETAAEKCEEDEEGFDGCSEYLYSTLHNLNYVYLKKFTNKFVPFVEKVFRRSWVSLMVGPFMEFMTTNPKIQTN